VWRDTEEKVELEIARLLRLVEDHRVLSKKVFREEPDAIELSALSAYLHSFYTGMENIFKQIAVDIDSSWPSAERWHSDLLDFMAHPTEKRPAVLSAELSRKLVRYLGFRHVFRHAYMFNLEWAKMRDLVLESEEILREVANSCRSLFREADP